MNKLLMLVLAVVSISSVAAEDDAYQTKEDAFSEWLILSTCMDYTKSIKEQNHTTDNGQQFLDCVNTAKKKQKAHRI